MARKRNTPVEGPKAPDADEVAEAVFSVDTKIFRTLWDTAIHTPRVVEAALTADKVRYNSPLKLLLILSGLLLTLTALMGFPMGGDLVEMLENADSTALGEWLADRSLTFAAFNEAYVRWSGIAYWPAMILSSLPYILLFKAYRPSRTFYGHVLVYVVTANASLVATFAALPAGLAFGHAGIFAASLFGIAWWFAAFGRALSSFYARTAWGWTGMMAGVAAMALLSTLIMIPALLLFAELGVRIETGASIFEFLMIASQGSPP